MPKKTPKNGFYYYMLDLQDQFVKQGMRKPSMVEMSGIAGPKWQELTPDEKEHYSQRAAIVKAQEKASGAGRLTSDGKLIAEVEEEMQEKEQEKLNMRRDVQNFVTALGSALEIANTDIFIMSFNILCATNEGQFIPNELGIVKLSLMDGVKDKFHKFIDPGAVPFGYSSDAKAHSEATHKLPIFALDFQEYDQNYIGIYEDIKRFLEVKRGQTVMVYCMPDHLEQNNECITWLHEKALKKERQQIAFADVTYLLMELAAAVDKQYSFESLAEDALNNHSFDFTENTRCDYHEELDNAHCAIALSQKISFILADALCSFYGIALTENHVPKRLTRNVIIETWKPKGPVKPVINRVNVPLKPVVTSPITTMRHNDRSIFVEENDVRVIPSVMNEAPSVGLNEPLENFPDLDDEDEFPSLVRRMQIKTSGAEEEALRQPRSCPESSMRRGNAWQQGVGRGSLLGPSYMAPGAASDTLPSTLQLAKGIGRGMRRKV